VSCPRPATRRSLGRAASRRARADGGPPRSGARGARRAFQP
jgi:hypothetical protein